MRTRESRSRRSRFLRLAGGTLVVALSACGKQEPLPPKATAEPAKSAAPAPPPVKVAPKPENVSITGVHTGLGIGQYNHVAKETSVFAPTDAVVISVYSDGSAKTASIGVTWMTAGGKVLAEQAKEVKYNGSLATPFEFSMANGIPAGSYRIQVRLNEWLAETAKFEVQ